MLTRRSGARPDLASSGVVWRGRKSPFSLLSGDSISLFVFKGLNNKQVVAFLYMIKSF